MNARDGYQGQSIPSMGGAELSSQLERFARESRGSAVEVGSWMGAGTIALARGISATKNHLYVYDRWRATEEEVRKAKTAGVSIQSSDDLLPQVRKHVLEVARNVSFIQGEITDAKYAGGPIGLYVDDAAKTEKLFRYVTGLFAPQWLDGATVVLMDFYHYRKGGERFRFQERVISAFPESFEKITLENSQELSGAAFSYRIANGRFRRWAIRNRTIFRRLNRP